MAAPSFSITSLLILTGLAFVVPVALARIPYVRIPVAVGEVLAGLIIGNSGLQLVRMDQITELFSFLGLASVMFVSGLEVNLELFARERKPEISSKLWYHPTAVAALVFLLSLLSALYVGNWLSARGIVESGIAAGLVVATAGLSLIVPVLKEREALNTSLGRVVLMTAMLGDFVPIAALAIVVPLLSGGDAHHVILVGIMAAAAIAVFFVLRLTRRLWHLPHLSHGPAQLGVRLAFALMLLFLVLAEQLGVETVLGAFTAGVITSLLAGSSARSTLIEKLDVLGFGLLAPFFFFSVGMRFDLGQLLSDPTALVLVPTLFTLTLAAKIGPGLLFLLWFPARYALAGATLLGSQMSVTIAAAALVQQAGLITPATGQAFVLVAMATAIVAPVLSARLWPQNQPTELSEKWVVTGASRQALILAQRLAESDADVVLVTPELRSKGEAKANAVDFVFADPTTEKGITKAATGATVVVAMSGDDAANLQVCRLAKELLGVSRTYALISSPEKVIVAQQAGVEVVNPELAYIQLLVNLVTKPESVSLLEQKTDVHITELAVSNPEFTGAPLRDLRLPPSVLFVALHRSGEKLIPHGDTHLQLKDRITVVGPTEDLELLHQSIGSGSAVVR